MKLAIIIACHNRKLLTINSIELCFLFSKNLFNVSLFVVDDCSSDGTYEVLSDKFSSNKFFLYQLDGNQYWTRSMAYGFDKAFNIGFDGYLWLNDDVSLLPDCFELLLDTIKYFNSKNKDPILVGNTIDLNCSKISYGGYLKVGSNGINIKLNENLDFPVLCDTFCGNFVYISHINASLIGNLDKCFKHTMGDIDYGFRARKLNVDIFTIPKIIGYCSNNPLLDISSLNIYQRLKFKLNIKNLPFSSWFILNYRYGGIFFIIYFLFPYIKVLFQR